MMCFLRGKKMWHFSSAGYLKGKAGFLMEGDKVCFMYYEELRLKQFSYTAFCLGAKEKSQLKFYVEERWSPSPSYSLVPLKHTRVSQDTSVVLSALQLILVPFV